MSFIKHAVHHMPHQSCMCLRPAPSCGAGAHGSEEGREGAGVTQQLVSPRLPAEVAAADARGGGAVLQHQEAECGEAAAGGQRRGKGTCESVGTHLRDLCVGSVGFRAQGSKRWRRKRERDPLTQLQLKNGSCTTVPQMSWIKNDGINLVIID